MGSDFRVRLLFGLVFLVAPLSIQTREFLVNGAQSFRFFFVIIFKSAFLSSFLRSECRKRSVSSHPLKGIFRIANPPTGNPKGTTFNFVEARKQRARPGDRPLNLSPIQEGRFKSYFTSFVFFQNLQLRHNFPGK